MKASHGKLLILAAVPMIFMASPSFAFTCDTNNPPTWDSGVTISKTDDIGWGTVIGPNFSLSRYVTIGTCGDIGADVGDTDGGSISAHAKLYNNVTLKHGSIVSLRSVLHSNVTLDNSRTNSYSDVGTGSTITGSLIGSHVTIRGGSTITDSSITSTSYVGYGSTIVGSQMSYSTQTGMKVNLTNAYMGRYSSIGDAVTVEDSAQIQSYAKVDSFVTIHDHAYIGSHAHICADVGSGVYIASYSSYGCQ